MLMLMLCYAYVHRTELVSPHEAASYYHHISSYHHHISSYHHRLYHHISKYYYHYHTIIISLGGTILHKEGSGRVLFAKNPKGRPISARKSDDFEEHEALDHVRSSASPGFVRFVGFVSGIDVTPSPAEPTPSRAEG